MSDEINNTIEVEEIQPEQEEVTIDQLQEEVSKEEFELIKSHNLIPEKREVKVEEKKEEGKENLEVNKEHDNF